MVGCWTLDVCLSAGESYLVLPIDVGSSDKEGGRAACADIYDALYLESEIRYSIWWMIRIPKERKKNVNRTADVDRHLLIRPAERERERDPIIIKTSSGIIDLGFIFCAI